MRQVGRMLSMWLSSDNQRGMMLDILRRRHRMLRIIWRPILVHRMHMMLLVAVPVRVVMLRILLGHHWPHLLWVVGLIAGMRPHWRRHVVVLAIMPPLRRLHGQWVLPIWVVVLLHFDRAFQGLDRQDIVFCWMRVEIEWR